METSELIKRLSVSVKPVQRLEAPLLRFARWVAVAIFSLGTGIFLFGVREDVPQSLMRMGFSAQAFALMLLALLSALSAFLLSVPDRKLIVVSLIPPATLGFWLLAIMYSIFTSGHLSGGLGLTCVRDIIALALLPGAFLFFMLKQAAPLEPSRVGVFSMLSVAGLGALATQFICRNDDPLHILLWHFLPVAVLGCVGVLIGGSILRWNRR